MTFVQIVIAFLIAYICVYALINRVCQCIEHCATARAYGKFKDNEGKGVTNVTNVVEKS